MINPINKFLNPILIYDHIYSIYFLLLFFMISSYFILLIILSWSMMQVFLSTLPSETHELHTKTLVTVSPGPSNSIQIHDIGNNILFDCCILLCKVHRWIPSILWSVTQETFLFSECKTFSILYLHSLNSTEGFILHQIYRLWSWSPEFFSGTNSTYRAPCRFISTY